MKFVRKKTETYTHSASERNFILGDDTSFVVDEAYNTLRSNLVFSMVDRGCKVIEFTSCKMSDGKSINVLNTAITFAETNAKVLLIDCDLRRPNINRLLGEKVSPGLTNVLVGASTLEESLQHFEEYNLDVLFSGNLPPNPSELLSSGAFADLIKRLRKSYEYIFIDTPPVGAVIDAAVVSKIVNGTVVVVRPGSTRKEELVNVVSQLEFAGAKVAGFVLNGVEYDNKSKFSRNNRYTYTKYGDSEKRTKAKPANYE